jgi:NitT/TauT family transport system permease protein
MTVAANLAHAAPAIAWRARFDTVLLVAALFVFWQLLHLFVGGDALPSPLAATRRLAHLLASPDFAANAGETARAFGYALVISWCGGLGLGVLLGANRLTGEVFEPMLVTLYAIPKITLYPVILLLFGLGISAKVAFGALHGIIPVVLFTITAVRNIHPVHLRSARALHLSAAGTALHVILPATLPEVFSGFRIGFALTLLGTLIGEMFASQRGIGYMLVHAMQNNEPEIILALALLLIVFATLASALLLALDRRLRHAD